MVTLVADAEQPLHVGHEQYMHELQLHELPQDEQLLQLGQVQLVHEMQ